jgi:DNA-binding MarR family transcriptional regulator
LNRNSIFAFLFIVTEAYDSLAQIGCGTAIMSKDQTEVPVLTGHTDDDAQTKKTRKAELKATEKARKAVRKALRKIEKQKRKDAVAAKAGNEPNVVAAKADTVKAGKKSKAAKYERAEGFSTTINLGAKLQAVARLMRGNLASQLLEHGLYAGQEQVLFLLDEHGPLALAELAEKLDIRAPTITKTVTRMEGQGFLSRAVSRDDARSTIISLNPEGRRVLKICRDIVEGTEIKTFAALSKADCASLEAALDQVFSHIKSGE